MIRSIILTLLLASSTYAANELTALVPSSSSGVYAVIRNPTNNGQGYDVTTDDGTTYLTYDRTDADQQIAMGSAIAVGVGDERQFATLPSGLSTTSEYVYDVYDSADELIGTFRYLPGYSLQSEVFADVVKISGSTPAADNAETAFTGTIDSFDDLDTAQDTQHSTTHNRLGAFTGSGNNTVLGFFQASLLNFGAAPTDLGGTYDPTTDSQQAARDSINTGVATNYSTLLNIESALDTIDGIVDNIILDTNEVQISLTTGGTVKSQLNTIQTAAEGAGSASSSALSIISGLSSDLGVNGNGLTALPWNSAWDAEIESESTDALNAYDPPTRTEATSDTNSVLTVLGTPADTDIATDISNVSSGGSSSGVNQYTVPVGYSTIRLMRLDGATDKTPFVCFANATHYYAPDTDTLYPIASTDLSALAATIPSACTVVQDGNSNNLPIYDGVTPGDNLTPGQWDLIVFESDNVLAENSARIPVYWTGDESITTEFNEEFIRSALGMNEANLDTQLEGNVYGMTQKRALEVLIDALLAPSTGAGTGREEVTKYDASGRSFTVTTDRRGNRISISIEE